jgi:hypothetical protein
MLVQQLKRGPTDPLSHMGQPPILQFVIRVAIAIPDCLHASNSALRVYLYGAKRLCKDCLDFRVQKAASAMSNILAGVMTQAGYERGISCGHPCTQVQRIEPEVTLVRTICQLVSAGGLVWERSTLVARIHSQSPGP